MTVLDPKPILAEADILLEKAKEELCRPDEDVVKYMVCKHAYKAIEKYMAGFLVKNGVRIHNSLSINDLLHQCRSIDPDFKKLNLDPLTRAGYPEDLWMNMKTANEFIDLAEQTRIQVGVN
ncbi:HEPN domain-containing protein [Algoriphagus alkaliphilus]|uniref:HEPN domain-containing protein n=1 Tax=Algoriphagus alkaliphilus TaxID=279824 RepID=A0A1G5V1U7_9BACT|nr:HEPN domain-containing protein [Algoriphagus alkaliphilus]SDA38975.1 HEPN domain-containing protein [Algoriphagus alkaliphilus]